LITNFTRHEPGAAPDGTRMDTPFYTVGYDFVLAPSEQRG
jgi:hydroxyquinol 1,2-dioxygenase